MPQLSVADLLAIKTDVTVTRPTVVWEGQTLLTHWASSGDEVLARFYNSIVAPEVLVWRNDVVTQDLIDTLVGSEYTTGAAGADVARRSLLDLITRSAKIDATKAQVRANFAQAAGATTQASWTALSRRPATVLEVLFAGAPISGAVVSTHYRTIVSPTDISVAHNA